MSDLTPLIARLTAQFPGAPRSRVAAVVEHCCETVSWYSGRRDLERVEGLARRRLAEQGAQLRRRDTPQGWALP